jgi:hypothetical protein
MYRCFMGVLMSSLLIKPLINSNQGERSIISGEKNSIFGIQASIILEKGSFNILLESSYLGQKTLFVRKFIPHNGPSVTKTGFIEVGFRFSTGVYFVLSF